VTLKFTRQRKVFSLKSLINAQRFKRCISAQVQFVL